MRFSSSLSRASALVASATIVFLALSGVDRPGEAAEGATSKEGQVLPLRERNDIALPGPANRFDYQSYDPRTHLLFVAHLGAGTIVVVNTESEKVVAEIPSISQVHGVLVVPELGQVYASATGTNEIVAIDEGSGKDSWRDLSGWHRVRPGGAQALCF